VLWSLFNPKTPFAMCYRAEFGRCQTIGIK